MHHGDVSPSLGANRVSGNPLTTLPHLLHVVIAGRRWGRESPDSEGRVPDCNLDSASWEIGKGDSQQGFQLFRLKPILEACCLSVSALSTLIQWEYFI